MDFYIIKVFIISYGISFSSMAKFEEEIKYISFRENVSLGKKLDRVNLLDKLSIMILDTTWCRKRNSLNIYF